MFAYCGNNPVNRIDITGDFFQDIDIDYFEISSRGGGSGGGYGTYNYGPGSAYHNYAIRTKTATYNAQHGGYYTSGLSSAMLNPNAYIVVNIAQVDEVPDGIGQITITYGDEKRLPTQTNEKDALSAWDDYLGPVQTSYNKFTGHYETNRIFSADGTKSVRFGNHEMKSLGTNKAHFHYEFWRYSRITNSVYVNNYLQRMK